MYLKGGLGVSQDGVPLEESKESMEAVCRNWGGLTSTRSAAIDMHSCLLSKLLGNCGLRALDHF